MNDRSGMSVIVKTVTRWLLGLVLIFGLAVTLFGHLSPGGGFAGGVILATGFVLVTLAFGAKASPAALFGRLASSLDAVGALAFLGIAMIGCLSGHFFECWIAGGEAFTVGSTPFIVLMNLAILLKVGAGIFAGFLALAVFRRVEAQEEGDRP